MRRLLSIMLLLPSLLSAQDLIDENLTPEQARAALGAGADVNTRSESDWPPLQITATHNENPEVLQILIDAGADIEEALGPGQNREQQAGEDAEGAYSRQGQTFHNRTREWRA